MHERSTQVAQLGTGQAHSSRALAVWQVQLTGSPALHDASTQPDL